MYNQNKTLRVFQFNFKQYNFKVSEDKRLRGLWSTYGFFFFFTSFHLVYGMQTCKLVGVCVPYPLKKDLLIKPRGHQYVQFQLFLLPPGLTWDLGTPIAYPAHPFQKAPPHKQSTQSKTRGKTPAPPIPPCQSIPSIRQPGEVQWFQQIWELRARKKNGDVQQDQDTTAYDHPRVGPV